MRFQRTAVAALLASSTLIAGPVSTATAATASDVFISEYIEGSSNNKAIEIYNGTGSAVDMSQYSIQVFFNGSASAGLTIDLTGNVGANDVFVLAQTLADPAILAQADQTNGAGWFNGDDAVVLRRGTTVIDVVGQIGTDPGSEWGTGLTSTADNTLRRKTAICAGDADGTNAFDPALEWDGFATNAFDGLGSHTSDCGGVVETKPVINEFSANTVGTDTDAGEYIEIYGPASTDLSSLTALQLEGDGSGAGVIDGVYPVGTTDSNGLYLIDLTANSLENGTMTLLLVDGFTGAAATDLDTDNDGTLDATPWTELVDGVGVFDGGAGDRTYAVQLAPSFDGGSFTPGGASRIPDGLDTDAASDWVRNDFDGYGLPGYVGGPEIGEAVNTPGAPNEVITVLPPRALPIHAVQGPGATTPELGNGVIVDGIVTADFQGSASFNGFYVQEPDADTDTDPLTSEGIFVFSNIDVSVGDFVVVTGVASEFNTLTEVGSVSAVITISTGNPLPAATIVSLPATNAEREAVEGMLVTYPQDLTISEFFNYDRFGEIVVSNGRQFQPTAAFDPGSPEATALAADNLLNRITIDDGRSTQNPDPAIHPNGDVFDLDNLFRGGDTLNNVTGIMDYAFGLYRIQPTQGADYTATNPRPSVPAVGGNLQVASFNVLNYFTTLGSRGANNAEEFTRQRDKIIAAISELDADVVGLLEIENNDAAIIDLVDGLNDANGAGTYDYIDTGVIGTDEIKVAIVYQPAAATPTGDSAILDSSVDPRFNDDKNRPALAQTFMSNDTGGLVTVVVNHLKSKGSPCDDVGDPDLGDGAGNCNVTRTLAAEALVDWTASDPTGVDSPTLIIGDLNSYDKEDPIDTLADGGYTDLVALFGGEFAYSYVFDGQLGYLDHALADADLLSDVTGTAVWHINADEPDLLDYNTDFKQPAQDAIYAPDAFRSSDHDPVLIGLDVCDAIAPELDVTLSKTLLWPPNHELMTITADVMAIDNLGDDVTIELVSVTSNEPDNGDDDGDTTGDIVIVDDTTFELRAERSGEGTGRIYTVTYSATDGCGNTTIATAEVLVPLSVARGRS